MISGRNYRLRYIWIISNGKFNRKRRRAFDETAVIFAIASLALVPTNFRNDYLLVKYGLSRIKKEDWNAFTVKFCIFIAKKKKRSITFPFKRTDTDKKKRKTNTRRDPNNILETITNNILESSRTNDLTNETLIAMEETKASGRGPDYRSIPRVNPANVCPVITG